MIELQAEDFRAVVPLYRADGMCFPLISAVLQNSQRGQVFVDRAHEPRAAFVVTNFGFLRLLGATTDLAFNAALARLLASGTQIKPNYVLWYAPPDDWQRRLESVASGNVRRRERVRFEWRAAETAYGPETVVWPAGFELRPLAADLIPKTEKFGVQIDARFWSSAADLLEHGVGVCLVKDGEVVSLCYAAAVADGLAEVDVHTQEEFRGRGLARLVTQQFIKECLRRGLQPTWDCFEYNLGSMRLAQSLGFAEMYRYPFYSFNLPLSALAATDA
jgi:GNAT superfamily N-acetyltransferase